MAATSGMLLMSAMILGLFSMYALSLSVETMTSLVYFVRTWSMEPWISPTRTPETKMMRLVVHREARRIWRSARYRPILMLREENMLLPGEHDDVAVGEPREYLDIARARHFARHDFAIGYRVVGFYLHVLFAVPLAHDALWDAQDTFALVSRDDDIGGHARADARILSEELQNGLVRGYAVAHGFRRIHGDDFHVERHRFAVCIKRSRRPIPHCDHRDIYLRHVTLDLERIGRDERNLGRVRAGDASHFRLYQRDGARKRRRDDGLCQERLRVREVCFRDFYLSLLRRDVFRRRAGFRKRKIFLGGVEGRGCRRKRRDGGINVGARRSHRRNVAVEGRLRRRGVREAAIERDICVGEERGYL